MKAKEKVYYIGTSDSCLHTGENIKSEITFLQRIFSFSSLDE